MTTASLDELEDDFKQMFLCRFIANGWPLHEIVFTDECCNDRRFFGRIVDAIVHETGMSVKSPVTSESPEGGGDLEKLSFPNESPRVILGSNNAAVVEAIDFIRENMDDKRVIGLDIEWEVTRAKGTPTPATVQICTPNGSCVVFRVLQGKRKMFPVQLKQLLEDYRVSKVGVGIASDCTLMRKAFDVQEV